MSDTKIHTYAGKDIEVTYVSDVTVRLSYGGYNVYIESDPLFANTDIGYKIKQDLDKPLVPGLGEVINFSFSVAILVAARGNPDSFMILREFSSVVMLCSDILTGVVEAAQTGVNAWDDKKITLSNWFDGLPTRNWDDLLQGVDLS